MFILQAKTFLEKTRVDALAVCIGNVHGKYPASGPKLDLNLLKVFFLYFITFSEFSDFKST